jgi:hypothetical protein
MILGTWQQLAAETDDLSISSDSDTVIEKTLNIYASPSSRSSEQSIYV